MRPRSRRRSEARTLAAFDEAVSLPRYGFVETVWHWRYEAMLAGIAFAVAVVLIDLGRTGLTVATALAAAVGLALTVPQPRRWVAARLWLLVTPHRLRAACSQARIHSRRGRLPVVLTAKVTPQGEEIKLWCRAGTAAEDLASARPLLRAACWATDVRVYRHDRHAQIVTVQVIRRSPGR